MSIGFVAILILLILRLILYFRPLKDFKSHFLFGIALPYLGDFYPSGPYISYMQGRI